MQITEIERTKLKLKSAGLKPKEYLGQNFLIDEEVLAILVAAAELKAGDTVLEVGPGLGVLTEKLVAKAKRVVAVEKDQRLLGLLQAKFKGRKNLEIFREDILRFHLTKHLGRGQQYKVVANIPYYLTSKLISLLLEQDLRPQVMVLMIQKEVAERIVAPPGDLSILALSVNFFAKPELIRVVPRQSFWPVPEVDSAILRITLKAALPEVDRKYFFRLLHFAFSGKRKQIHNTLGKALGISKDRLNSILMEQGLSSSVRPQELSLEHWLNLSQRLVSEQREKKTG